MAYTHSADDGFIIIDNSVLRQIHGQEAVEFQERLLITRIIFWSSNENA